MAQEKGADEKEDTVQFRMIIKQMHGAFIDQVAVPFDSLFADLSMVYSQDNSMPLRNTGVDESNTELFLYNPLSSAIYQRTSFLNPFGQSTEGLKFYSTTRPFTDVLYQSSGTQVDKFQRIKVFHTQNFTERLNVGFNVKRVSGLGSFDNQETHDAHWGVWADFKRKQSSYAVRFNRDSYKNGENGGLENFQDYIDNAYDNLSFYPVLLDQAKSESKFSAFRFVQSYRLGKEGTWNLTHLLGYERAKRSYSDSGSDTTFYMMHGIDSIVPFDSLYSGLLSNALQLSVKKTWFNRPIQQTFEVKHAYQTKDLYYSQSESFSDVLLLYYLNSLDSASARFGLNLRYEPLGYYSGDYSISGYYSKIVLKKINWQAELTSMQKKADWLFSNLYLNGFNNDANSPLRMTELSNKFSLKELHLALSVKAGIALNTLFITAPATVVYQPDAVQYVHLGIEKEFILKRFRWNNLINYQYINNDLQKHYPSVLYHSDIFYQNELFKKALMFRLGARFWYIPGHYIPGYSPLTALFYYQDSYQSSNYPMVNVYGMFKIRSVRILLEYHHLDRYFMADPYFSAYACPGIPSRFTFGIRWLFVD